MFEELSNKVHFPDMEKEIRHFWETEKIFEKSLKNRENSKRYTFYDGPPFATGLPHYGHLLAGTIKDIIPRYYTMKGYYVEREFGWDCHGLPVEMEMQNELKLNTTKDIEAYGIGKFNEACRNIVLRYTSEWEETVKRMGRWVKFEGGYKTMDRTFMESVWWVFKELYHKGLIYEGYKVLPYSWKAGTTLSNFEANLNYKDVQDPAITIKFPSEGEDRTYFLAWTTTPWTLISNLALCVNGDMKYVKIKDKPTGEYYYLASSRLETYYKNSGEYKIVEELPGHDLTEKFYKPLFDYASREIDISKCFRILADDYVKDDDGTGIVHQAPAYGEDDSRVCQKYGIPVYDAVDESGAFRPEIDFVAGENIKDADSKIIRALKDKHLIVQHGTSVHSYPFCWRTDTPLIYKAISTWFVKVADIRDNMAENNRQINWMPRHIKEGRMGKGIGSAPDWNISRNRFWGTPIPVWKSDDGDVICIGSARELEERSGQKVDDLHKHFVDDIKIHEHGKVYRRVPEVLDCWFESGSMPYAQIHYPFENKEKFENSFPAQFIAEGLDQTRGWFYTLITLASALFKKPPFKNVVVNGLILAEDGKKMSKRLKNYPAPSYILDNYGADALRMYMIGSAVVRAESLKFSEQGVKDIIKSIMLPLWNSFTFFISYANIDGYEYKPLEVTELKHPLDKWILSYLEQLVAEVSGAMDQYDLKSAVPPFVRFIDRLTNWYIRLSRRRFWKSENDHDKEQAYFTLYTVLLKLSSVIAPFMPFTAEKIYLVLKQDHMPESVHLCDFPIEKKEHRFLKLEKEMELTQTAVMLGRSLRLNHKIKIRQPLGTIYVISRRREVRDLIDKGAGLIKDELNIKELLTRENEEEFVSLKAKANFRSLGKKYGKKVQEIAGALAKYGSQELKTFIDSGTLNVTVGDTTYRLEKDDIIIEREEKEGMFAANEGEITVVLDTSLTDELVEEGIARDFINKVQKQRKENGFHYADRIEITYYASSLLLSRSLKNFEHYITQETLAEKMTPLEKSPGSEDGFMTVVLRDDKIMFKIHKI